MYLTESGVEAQIFGHRFVDHFNIWSRYSVVIVFEVLIHYIASIFVRNKK